MDKQFLLNYIEGKQSVQIKLSFKKLRDYITNQNNIPDEQPRTTIINGIKEIETEHQLPDLENKKEKYTKSELNKLLVDDVRNIAIQCSVELVKNKKKKTKNELITDILLSYV